MRDFVFFYCNGRPETVHGTKTLQPLSSWLRQRGLTGTKVVCAEGDCGACTVLLGHPDGDQLRYEAVNSCILSVHQLDGRHVVTVEGLAWEEKLHPVQIAMRDGFGSQCGYCTPGIVMALAANYLNPTEAIRPSVSPQEALRGNLCRCTGYEAIVAAAQAVDEAQLWLLAEQYPPERMLQSMGEQTKDPFSCQASKEEHELPEQRQIWRPRFLSEALAIKKVHPQARWLSGGTDLCVQINKEKVDPKELIALGEIAELQGIKEEGEYLIFGASTTWQELEDWCQQSWPSVIPMLELFASPQIRNRGTIGGNLANASPVADSLPWLYVSEAEVGILGGDQMRWVPIHQFYLGYKKLDLSEWEMIHSIRIHKSKRRLSQRLYKVSKRRDLDISTFTAALQWERRESQLRQIRIAYGGVGPTVLRLPKTEKLLTEAPLNMELIQQAGALAAQEITPISDVRSSAAYRTRLASTILHKFYWELKAETAPVQIPS